MATPFDDVFRTLVTKRTDLMIPMVNEMFSLCLPGDVRAFVKNDIHLFGGQRLETDSLIQIGGALFHIECESGKKQMPYIRMVEYDFIAALEDMDVIDGLYQVNFPNSGVIMLRAASDTETSPRAYLHYADGEIKTLRFKLIGCLDYNSEEIFQKKLYFILPFYIIRYEDLRTMKDGDEREKMKKELIADIRSILDRLLDVCQEENRIDTYEDIRSSMAVISAHIFRNTRIKEEVDKIMRGKILDLPSDRLREAEKRGEIRGIEIGEAKGIEIGEAKGTALGEKKITDDILVIGPMFKKGADDSTIAEVTGWKEEKIQKYRSILSCML